jgi:cell division protein FtsL
MRPSVERYRATNKLKRSFLKQLVSSRFIVPVLILATVVLLPCILVWQNVYVMSLVSEVSALEQDHSQLDDALKKKRAEIIELSRLSRIEKIAVEDLHMTPVKSENMYTLTVNQSLDVNDGIDEVVESLKKFADHLPVVSESRAATEDLFDER